MARARESARKGGKHDGQRAARTERGGAMARGGDGERKRARTGGARTSRNGRKRSEREIEEIFGFVPSFYGAMPDSAIEAGWMLQRDVELAETTLDPVTKELIGLAIASHIKCRYCIYYHTEAALHHGATEEQLREAVAMGGLTVLWSNALSGAQVDMDRFRMEIDRAFEHLAEVRAEHGSLHATA